MQCPTCSAATRVRETRETLDGAVKRRQRVCPQGHVSQTFEIDEATYRAARFDIERVARNRPFHAAVRARHERTAEMRCDRLAGMNCPEIAVKYGISVDMARYYTRLPRARIYSAVRIAQARRDTTLQT